MLFFLGRLVVVIRLLKYCWVKRYHKEVGGLVAWGVVNKLEVKGSSLGYGKKFYCAYDNMKARV